MKKKKRLQNKMITIAKIRIVTDERPENIMNLLKSIINKTLKPKEFSIEISNKDKTIKDGVKNG